MRPALEILASRGHRLHIATMKHDRDDFRRGCDELCAKYPNVTYQLGPVRRDRWSRWAEFLRATQSFVQSQELRFDNSCRLADRQRLAGYPMVLDWKVFKWGPVREFAWRFLRLCNDALPPDANINVLFEQFSPDVMIITPLLDRSGEMWDYMASARFAGVRTVFPVHSWDNLSSKARVNIIPDRVLVWNECQVDEAVRFHRIPKDRIDVTGAQGFDDWFSMRPSMSRLEFCEKLGLKIDKPILLVVCSAILKRHMAREIANSKTELPFFTRWIGALRKSADLRLSKANVIVRPHPKRADHWDDVDLRCWGNVAVYPKHGRLPNDAESKTAFFDSLYHADVVIGLSTSAMIEAGILGRPVTTVLDPDYQGAQTQMQHFRYLLNIAGGLLIAAQDYAEHICQLSALLDSPAEGRRRAYQFTREFVRPLGLDVSAAPVFAEHVIATAALGRKQSALPGLRERSLLVALAAIEKAAAIIRKSKKSALAKSNTSPEGNG
jgi:hypothetical protein